MKKCYIIAGPNGAGKTTFAKVYLPSVVNIKRFVNADLIAAGISPFDPNCASIQAAKLMLREMYDLEKNGESFGIESTLSGINYVRHIHRLRKKGYFVSIYYLKLSSVELAYKRVECRVAEGGHSIPKNIIKRRFVSGWDNFQKHYKLLADEWAIFDNSEETPILVEDGNNEFK